MNTRRSIAASKPSTELSFYINYITRQVYRFLISSQFNIAIRLNKFPSPLVPFFPFRVASKITSTTKLVSASYSDRIFFFSLSLSLSLSLSFSLSLFLFSLVTICTQHASVVSVLPHRSRGSPRAKLRVIHCKMESPLPPKKNRCFFRLVLDVGIFLFSFFLFFIAQRVYNFRNQARFHPTTGWRSRLLLAKI